MQRVIIFLISLLLRRIRKGRIYRNLRNRPCLPPPFEIVSIAQQMMRNRRRRFKIQLLSTAATSSETSKTLKTTRKPQPTQNQQHVNLSEGCAPSSQPTTPTSHTNQPHQPATPTSHTNQPHQQATPTSHTNKPHQPATPTKNQPLTSFCTLLMQFNQYNAPYKCNLIIFVKNRNG